MSVGRVLMGTVTATASLMAIVSITYSIVLGKMGPTPEELATRFSVFADDPGNPSAIVAKRILALDSNGDTYVALNELPERMKSLMRSDRNDDGLLSANEVKALVVQAAGSHPRFPPPPLRRGRPTTLVDIVRDQKLPQPTHDFAMALVQNPVVAHSTDLYARLRKVMNREEYENFQAAARRTGLVLEPGEMPID
jgi:hypothetical protein